MRKGRGLVDNDIYEELLKVPGMRTLLLSNTTNHRTDPRSGKIRAEIHEDVWPEVKHAVANWKRMKAGKPQIPFKKGATGRSASSTSSGRKRQGSAKTVADKLIERRKKLKRGDDFVYKNDGAGVTSYEHGGDIIRKRGDRLYTETFESMGMTWDGSTWKFDGGFGIVTTVILPEEVPADVRVS